MKRTVRLDEVLGITEPFATFHDASLLTLNVDYERRNLIAEFDIYAGNPDAADHAAR